MALAGYLFTFVLSSSFVAAGTFWPLGSAGLTLSGACYGILFALQLEYLVGLTGMGESWWLRAVQSLNHALFLAIGWAGFQAAAPKWLPAIEPGWMIIHWVNLGLAIALVLSRRSKASGVPFLPICLAIYFLSNAIGYSNPRPLTLGGVRFNNTIMGNIVFGALLVGERLYRLRRSAAEAARLAGQFAAARSVQQMLLLGSVPDTPGLEIDPVYRPADEVGGDFFRILAAPGAETLLIVGDVSGKGLKAAMLVRVIVGALVNRRSSEPGAVLAELNGALAGQMDGGFVTCGAALFRADGTVTLANAGHLAPYLGGRELEMEPGLPLGIIAGAEYGETTVELGNERMMFLSDGVVEAENAAGELFGFDRTREGSKREAGELAEAARAWGQNDDITVVTVRRRGRS